jgi:hypothetical protein
VGFFEDTIRALNEADVRYVVVGGVAVALHGHVRATFDLDIVIDLSPEEAARAMDALVEVGLRPKVPVEARAFADPSIRAKWIEDKGMVVFAFWNPNDDRRSVDVFVQEPIPFEELWSRSVVFPLGTTSVRVASIEDLLVLKRRAGRPVDLGDIQALEAILQERADD